MYNLNILTNYVESEKLFEKKVFRTKFYDGKKHHTNQEYVNITHRMDLARTIDSLFNATRANIIKICKHLIEFNNEFDVLMFTLTQRSLIERLATFCYYARLVENSPIPKNLDDLSAIGKIEELMEKIVRGNLQTSLDIPYLLNTDIRNVKLREYAQGADPYDLSPLNILTPIKQIDKKIKGINNCYSILCQFAHPNFLDKYSSVTQSIMKKDEFGDYFLEQTIAASKKRFVDPSVSRILVQTTQITQELIQYYWDKISYVEEYQIEARAFCRALVQDDLTKINLKKNLIRKGSKCPCLSGKRILECCGPW
jgi:hypothetical protein